MSEKEKEVKSLLKEARDAIKNKNYEAAIKSSKQVLKLDKENYTALVFLGASFQETGPSSKALSYLNEAVKVNPKNPLAWNGLASFYEKSPEDKNSKNELSKVYLSILETETNEKKLMECCEKLSGLSAGDNFTEIVSAIYKLTKSEALKNNTAIQACLAKLISQQKDAIPPEILQIYEECLSALISNKDSVTIQYYSDYLHVLYKQSKLEKLFEQALKMHSIYEKELVALKWICKIFNECFVENNIMISSNETMFNFSELLLKFEENSATALFVKSILLYEQQKFAESRDMLYKVVELIPGLLHGWILLMKCTNNLYLYNEAAFAANKVIKLSKNSDRTLSDSQWGMILEVLSRSEEDEDLLRCLQIYTESSEKLREVNLIHVIRASISLNKLSEAKTYLSSLKDKVLCNFFKAQILHKEANYQAALDLLLGQESDYFELYMEIGLIYWSLGQIEKCLIPFLKAAKLAPDNYKCFLLLGNYYTKTNDPDKARRCYEKAFKLNGRSSEVALELTKIYRKLKNWDANIALLQSLTAGVINKKNSWAWLQLGLNYLEQQDYDKAVNNLRLVVRLEETNVHCWEALADCYLARGAHGSALLCYERAHALQPDALYPLLRTATVRQTVGELEGARSAYEAVLATDVGRRHVVALKGAAETRLAQAAGCRAQARLGTARDHVQAAVRHLEVAVAVRPDLSCLWKLIGDSCMFVAALPEVHCCLITILMHPTATDDNDEKKPNEESRMLEREALYAMAERCYCRALSLVDDPLLWHDLGACYLAHARSTDSAEDGRSGLVEKAGAVAHRCTVTNPTCAAHWNLLGNVALNTVPKDLALAQHCFIKAVIADNNSAVAWCNLGALYFTVGDYKLANEAFSQAQRGDPNYVNSWIGQALLAETMAHEDAMDLFRHSTQLTIHKQGALGYAHWVCHTLKESPLDVTIYSIHNMHAIPVACDALSWYIEYEPMDGSAWNMLGILRERLGLNMGACEAFKNAVALTDGKSRDLAKINYGRALAKLGKFEESIQIFGKVEEATLNSGIGLALSLFNAKMYKESYEAYESALQWLSDSAGSQSELLVALASMAYMFDGVESAKTLLFQSIRSEQASSYAFYAIMSLAILHKDLKLCNLVMKELHKSMDRRDCVEHVARLTGYFYFLQGKFRKAVQEASKTLHRYPNEPKLWLILSLLLIRLQGREGGNDRSAKKCAQFALKNRTHDMDIRKVFCWVSLSSLVAGDLSTARIAAQKSVHLYPDMADSWAVLHSAVGRTETSPGISAALKKLNDSQIIAKPLKEWICNVVL